MLPFGFYNYLMERKSGEKERKAVVTSGQGEKPEAESEEDAVGSVL